MIIQSLLLFIQDQLLGMKWLEKLLDDLLSIVGIDTAGKLGGSIHFFLYDVIKITLLLCILIFIRRSEAERSWENIRESGQECLRHCWEQ